jgi:hypothetical protein
VSGDQSVHLPTVGTSSGGMVLQQLRKPSFLRRIRFVSSKRRAQKIVNRFPSVLLSNVRSLVSKMDEVKLRVSQLHPSIVIFTESWLSDETPDSAVALDGYSVSRKDRNSLGGGIICFIKDDVSFSVIVEHEVPSLPVSNSEFLCIFLKTYNLMVICVYHPFWNNCAADEAAISVITRFIDYACVKFGSNIHIMICGDINGLRVHSGELMRLTRLSPIVDFATRGVNTLDQIFSNFAIDQKASAFPPLGRSDHCVIFWSPSPVVNKCVTKRTVRKFSKANIARFRFFVSSTNWLSLVNSSDDLDVSTSLFMNSLTHLFDLCFPSRVVRVKDSDPEWMNPSLKILIDDRDRAFSNHQWSKYHRLREEVVAHTRHLKAVFMKKAASTNSSRIWHALRLLGRFGKTSTATVFSANEFSSHFTSNFQTFPDDLLDFPSAPLEVVLSPEEIYASLRRLANKGGGPDGIPAWFFKDSAFPLSSAICAIFNRCFKTASFPSFFKMANVVPIPKICRPTYVGDFRPISMLPVLSKLLERFFLSKVVFPLVIDRISVSQFAYIPRPGSGTISALVTVHHKILQFLDSASGAVRFLSTDFSKAFDKLPHHVILSACRKFDLPEPVICFVSSFLSHRKQRVCVNNKFSEWVSVSSGVPQGSVLGPFLFCLAVDSLQPVCDNSIIIKYADDISILHFIREPSDDNLQQEWDNIVSWSQASHLPLNLNKCRVLDFVTKRSLSLCPVKTAPSVFLECVDSLPFLGVRFSSSLKWNVHFDFVLKKACKRIFIIRNLRRSGVSPIFLWRSYVSLIRPVLLYAFPCVCNAPMFLVNKLLRVERRIKRIINDDSVCTPSLLQSANESAERLFNHISRTPRHPLRNLFNFRPMATPHELRTRKPVQRPLAKTKRFSSSFIKFCT